MKILYITKNEQRVKEIKETYEINGKINNSLNDIFISAVGNVE